MTTSNMVLVSLTEIRRIAQSALAKSGCDAENATAVAGVMVAAERDGCASHGLFRLAGYLASLRSGKVNGTARPSVARLAPSVIQVDGHGGFAPLAMGLAREALEGVRLPGDRRAQNRARIASHGARLPAKLWEETVRASEKAVT